MFRRKRNEDGNGVEYVIAGLGNPGREYELTRHNAGFLALDILADKYDINVTKLKHKALTGTGMIGGHKVMLVKPQTYMNLSGESLREVLAYYKIPVEKLIVIYDDIDLKAGDLRIRKKGSAGTHNGMKSIIYQLDSDEFPRIRVGIGNDRRGSLTDYVIGRLSEEEIKEIKPAIENAAEAAAKIVQHGTDKAMNEFNKRKKKNGETQ